MIYLYDISKTYGRKDLFKNLSLSINRGEKIGLVGPNGAGKSTLFFLILGQIEACAGNIQINRGVRIGYLPQEARFDSQSTVLSEVLGGDETIRKLEQEKESLELNHKAGSKRYGEVLHDLEFLGYFDLEHRTKKILSGLGFKPKDFNRPVCQMSGGWQMRTLLAKLLVYHYDILLLDEPMNHLDLVATLWFKDYLANFKESFIMISHDKDFLNDVTNYTLVLEQGILTKVRGNYDDYQKIMDEKRSFLQKQFNEQQKKREQLKTFISRFHGQPNKAAQVRAKKRMLDRMAEIIVPPDRRESIRRFSFPQAKASGYQVIELKNISKFYGDIRVYKDFDFEIIRGEKGVFVGENGAGKSTLLKILAGVTDIDSGQRCQGYNTDIGYFSQTRMDILNPYNTVFEEAYSASAGRVPPGDIRTILAVFLFSGDDVDKKVSILSGGEKSRLILAKLLINPPNLLLLDEPTTHLDVDAVDALIKALTDYTGTLVFISHDIHFVRSVANAVFEVKDARVKKFPGNFDYYWQKTKEAPAPKDDFKNQNKNKSFDSQRPKPKKLSAGARERERTKHNSAISKKIRELRKELGKIELERNVKARILSNPRSYHNKEMVIEYGRILKQIEQRISEINLKIKKLKDSFI